jgi:hypothetical protein
MHFSESAHQITPGTDLKTKAPRKKLFCWAMLSSKRPNRQRAILRVLISAGAIEGHF